MAPCRRVRWRVAPGDGYENLARGVAGFFPLLLSATVGKVIGVGIHQSMPNAVRFLRASPAVSVGCRYLHCLSLVPYNYTCGWFPYCRRHILSCYAWEDSTQSHDYSAVGGGVRRRGQPADQLTVSHQSQPRLCHLRH